MVGVNLERIYRINNDYIKSSIGVAWTADQTRENTPM